MIPRTCIGILAAFAALLGAPPTAGAQDLREHVELIVSEGRQAIFCSEGFADNRRDAVEHSQMAVLRRLLYDGVADYNEGYPIVSSGRETNLWLKNFFEGKNAAYKMFLQDVEVVGNFDTTPQGEHHCRTHVVVNLDALLRSARIQGVMQTEGEGEQATPPAMPAEKKSHPKSFL